MHQKAPTVEHTTPKKANAHQKAPTLEHTTPKKANAPIGSHYSKHHT